MSEMSAADVFTVDHVISIDDQAPAVRLVVATPDHEAEMTMPPESALWLALELWKASRLPLNHNLRFRRGPLFPDTTPTTEETP